MEQQTLIEIFGYISSAVVVASFAMTSLKKLRIVNGLGCIFSVFYAVMVSAYPVVVMNSIIALIDLYQLYQLRRVHVNFEVVPAEPDSAYFKWFTAKYAKDLAFDTNRDYAKADKIFYYVRDNEVAGILAYNETSEHSVDIVMDYVIDKFRDCRIGRYFFGNENSYFGKFGITEFTTKLKTANHKGYLKQLGFEHKEGEVWIKSVKARPYFAA